MDPLSITAAAVSFVDIARRIKDSVEKVGQTRRNLQQLVEDIIEELTELQKLCQDGQGHLNHIDPDSTRSLRRLHSDLSDVLERCLKITERRKGDKGLSYVKYHFSAWLKNAEIESDILRLRDRVSSVHRRFTMVASLRAERADGELLIFSSEQRVAMRRMEGLLSRLLIDSHASGTYPASALDHASPDGIEYRNLHLQVQKTVALLDCISATHTFTIEETRGPEPFRYLSRPSWPSQASLMRSTTIRAFETLQLLELEPSNLALWEGADHLLDLGNYLYDLGLEEDAAAIFIGVSNVYQTLMQRNARTYLPYVAWGLRRLFYIHFGTLEGLGFAKRAVHICRETATMLQEDYCVDLARSLCIYSDHLSAKGHFDEALTYAAEALAMQRKAPTAQQGSDCLVVSWEASGEERVALSSARTISRAYDTAIDEMSYLGVYAYVLLSMGRWSEALIITTEAINCLGALGKCDSWVKDVSFGFPWVYEDHQYVVSKICSPSSPLAASISVDRVYPNVLPTQRAHTPSTPAICPLLERRIFGTDRGRSKRCVFVKNIQRWGGIDGD
ncbi:hypothetical protein CCMSSC00406_0006075 [Pleurotus cornucopiae]|uniref:Uncharacterized protein n=1 Tax=Pleurotus cornucopiae TaxID=5321 RepID=A0ACB7J936_PLECO|nr:hypothetical protein CCMSSC00406_0006075 [Pleurotus cornucopiae]